MEIVEPLVTVRGDGREYHMIMDVFLVRMSGHDERKVATGEPQGQLVAQTVGNLRCDLTGLERLSDLIGDDLVTRFASGAELIDRSV